MTKEQAVAILKQPDRIGCHLIKATDEESCKFNQESIEALNMAIEALKQQSDDCVSRKAVKAEEKLKKIGRIVERFKNQYDHTSNLDLMIEIKEVLEQE